jgi:hypothetical protein
VSMDDSVVPVRPMVLTHFIVSDDVHHCPAMAFTPLIGRSMAWPKGQGIDQGLPRARGRPSSAIVVSGAT